MILYDKRTGFEEEIFGVLDDDHGYPKFLIRKDSKWVYRSAKHYIPRTERIRKPYNKLEEEYINTYGYIPTI
jgi:hypothetical protein